MTKLKDLRRKAFMTEDETMIEAQQRTLDAAGPGVKPVLLSVDGASVQYRRVLERLQKQEQSPPQSA
ncbi:hypothetical protein HK414_06445 [Ramlibacter terrae]|uniref:Vanillate O-demethylase oxygenase-like C-terminal catalytic domain-containing protein n=1 Tax=Ramlibacter terrae TaxID=2732511 RepID=A0ABX6P121_9BURK|nr:hypothetical protein HK414_06445 [Ramlibacter terrae]